MSELKISLPGPEIITIAGQTIDKLVRAGDGDAALLYLYILRTHEQKELSESEIAIALDKSKGWVASAMAVLSRLRLINLDNINGAKTGNAASDSESGIDSLPPYKEPRPHTEDEVKQVLQSGSDFSVVIEETQRRLGKQLSPDELLRLYGIYDNLRLPPEVILLLITHCIRESRITGDGRAPNVKYIEKAAYTWEREGIFSLERAEEYLKALESKKSVRGEMKRVLCIWDREFSATQKRYVDDWIEMGMEPDAIAIAYDKTMVKTGSLAWPYIDKIVRNWHIKGLLTAQQVQDSEGGSGNAGQSQGNFRGASQGKQKHGEPNRADIERMQRLLDKTKNN
ncbi:MAG: DnaD domain protein [Oscillospiraceae bacterium]|nr:DnaD domain protein [Oscillospiraceae bacterium]